MGNVFPKYRGVIITCLSVGFDVSSATFFVFDITDFSVKSLFIALGICFGIAALIGGVIFPQKSHLSPQLVKNKAVAVQPWTVKQALKSGRYWWFVVFIALQTLRLRMYAGYLVQVLPEYVGGTKENVSFYSLAFGLILPATGLLAAVPVGLILDRFHVAVSLWIIGGLGVLYSGLALMIFAPITAQISTMIIVGIYRAVLFSTTAVFIGKFGFEHFGVLFGIRSLVSSMFVLLQLPISILINQDNDQHYFYVNVADAIVSMLLCLYPLIFSIKN
jgi:hypothetical protein